VVTLFSHYTCAYSLPTELKERGATDEKEARQVS
jgi:hypothetical protein